MISPVISPVISMADTDVAQCYVDNSWWCGQYWSDYRPELIDATVQHLWITVVSVLLGLAARCAAGPPGPPQRAARDDRGRHHDDHLHHPVAGAVLAAAADHGAVGHDRGDRSRALLADDPGAQRAGRPPVRARRGARVRRRRRLRAGPAADPRRAAAVAARPDGGPAGRHGVHGRPDHDRLDRLVRRPGQPAAAGRRQPVQGADPRSEPACASRWPSSSTWCWSSYNGC